MTLPARSTFLLSSSASLLLGLGGTAISQTAAPAGSGTTALPKIEVIQPRRAQPPRRPQTRVTTGQRRETPAAPPPPTEAQVVAGKNDRFDEARHNILAPTGAGSYPSLAGNSNLEAAGYPIHIVVNGRRGMPPFGDMMTDGQVAAVVNYLRTHFGNNYQDAVTVGDVRDARR